MFFGFYCLPFFLGVPLPLTHNSREGHKQNLFAICKKWKGGNKKEGAPKDCKIVQHESSDACCFQSAVCQLEAWGVCARTRKDNAEK